MIRTIEFVLIFFKIVFSASEKLLRYVTFLSFIFLIIFWDEIWFIFDSPAE